MKVLVVCNECGKLVKEEVICAMLFTTDGRLVIHGLKNISLEHWDKLARQLPEMVRHEHVERREELNGN